MAEALLAAGADKDVKTQGGHTAHDAASTQGHLAVAQALLRESLVFSCLLNQHTKLRQNQPEAVRFSSRYQEGPKKH